MIHKFHATFGLRSGRVNKDGTVSVLLRMRLNDERINICTGICVCPKFWNQEKQCVSSRSPDAVMQNSMLQSAYQNIYETFRKKEALMGDALTAAAIRDAFLGRDRIRHEFISVYHRGHLLPAMCNKCTNEYLKEIAAKCQIYEELHYHMARHTFATIAISNGFPLESVQYILGHTTMKQTLHYAKILSTKVLDDMRQLGDKLSDLKLPNDF